MRGIEINMLILPVSHPASKECLPIDLLSAALDYAARGWSIIPTSGKQSAHHWKQFQAEPADEATLRRMFGHESVSGLAVILGSASQGLACRDYDDATSYYHWAADHPELASTLPTVQTSRGFHVYFQGPEGFQKLGDGEYRATSGQYCLLPPSRNPTGTTYSWRVPLPQGNLPEIDPRAAGMLAQAGIGKQYSHPPTYSSHTTHLCEQELILREIAATLPTEVGQRRFCLFQLARRLKAIMPNATGQQLKPIVREWYQQALPIIGTKEFSVSWEDFFKAWTGAKSPFGAKWSEIKKAAEEMEVDTFGHDGAFARIIRLCAALQAHHGPGTAWPLSCRLAAKFAHISNECAARILKALVFEEFIELVKPGGNRKSKQAAEYRLCEVPR